MSIQKYSNTHYLKFKMHYNTTLIERYNLIFLNLFLNLNLLILQEFTVAVDRGGF